MAFNVNYSFNNGATTGTATSSPQLRKAVYDYGLNNLTQATLSGTAEGNLTANERGTAEDTSYGIFQGCENLVSVDVSNLDVSAVTSLKRLFTSCSNLITITGLENWDVSSVTNIQELFSLCSNLSNESIAGISKWNTSSLSIMISVFTRCEALTTIDLSSWDTSSVTYMTEAFKMFNNNLQHIYVGSKWDVSSVNYSDDMFYGCNKLPNFNSTYKDKTKAYVGDGGYLEKKMSDYIITQQYTKYDGFVVKSYPKVKVDGSTIIDTNGVISATAQSPEIATTSTPGIVKPDGTSITINASGTISASATTADVVLLTQAEYNALTPVQGTLYVIIV